MTSVLNMVLQEVIDKILFLCVLGLAGGMFYECVQQIIQHVMSDFVFTDKIVKEIALKHKGTVELCNYLKTKVESTVNEGRA